MQYDGWFVNSQLVQQPPGYWVGLTVDTAVSRQAVAIWNPRRDRQIATAQRERAVSAGYGTVDLEL